MTISLTYDDVLSRVQIVLSSLDHDGAVRVERSTNQLHWEVVRGGAALPVSGGSALLDDYEFADEEENFYRVLAVEPPAGLLIPGTGGDASTPDHASLDTGADFEIRAFIQPTSWNNGDQAIVTKYRPSDNHRSYSLRILNNGRLRLTLSTNGTATATRSSNVAVPVEAGKPIAVRTTNRIIGVGQGSETIHYTGPTISGPWTQLGSPVTGTIETLFDSSAPAVVGADADGGWQFEGSISVVEVRDGVGGTVVANPDFSQQDHGAASFVDQPGRTWTINSDAQIVGDIIESDSITPSLQGKIRLKSIRYPFLNRTVKLLDRGQVIVRESRSGTFPVSGRSNPTAVAELLGGHEFTHYIQTEGTNHLEAARNLDLTISSGDIFFIHVPKGVRAPGGYVVITGGSNQERMFHGSDKSPHVFEINCSTVNPPGPGVVGTTLTWGTIFNIYGGWGALLNANPTWADLLETVGSPDDVFVP